MWHRKQVDNIKVRRIWWLEPEQWVYHRKNRKKCTCYSCGNPRRTGLESPKTLKERAALLAHNDEINEVLSYV
jgi:hypothetical protein